MESSNTELILIRITGEDRPGLTSSIMGILARYDVTVLDIGQADPTQYVDLGLVGACGRGILRACDAGFAFQGFGIGREHPFLSGEERRICGLGEHAGQEPLYPDFVGTQAVGFADTGRHFGVGRTRAEHRCHQASHRRIPLDEQRENIRACIEFSVRGTPKDRAAMQSELLKLSSELEMDFSFQLDNMYRRMRRLICFDMDSTLIETEVIDELADRAGVGEQVRAITERAMRGEIDFKESFTQRVALLKGLDVSVMEDIAQHLPITEGVDRLMFVLKQYGYKIAILSGGFTYFGNYLKNKYDIDYVYANELEIEDGKLTGRYVGEIVDGRRKAELLKLIAQVEHVHLAQTIAVGDGANDLPMLSEAGLGIAFHAKPRVVANAKQSINTMGLDGVLYFLGFKDSYLEERGKL